MKKILILCAVAAACVLPARGQMRATRTSALSGARNLTVTTAKGTTYYYLVSTNDVQTMHFSEEGTRIGKDYFGKGEIQSMRFRSLPRLLLNEDSLTFNKAATLDYGLVALKRELWLNAWNSIVLPIDLTTTQVREAFGEDARLAVIHGVSNEEETIVEFQAVDLKTEGTAMRANYHYVLWPTKDPDVLATSTLANFGSSRVRGPIYLLPNVSMKANQTARYQTLKSTDEVAQVRFRGTYTTLDGSTAQNKKVEPGVYAQDEDTHDFVLHEDSVSVKAFRSWVKDISAEPKTLKFYVDGVELTDGIMAIDNPPSPLRKGADAIYDLSGRRMLAPAGKGIYIINGKKVIK